jgi:hypothetical protein
MTDTTIASGFQVKDSDGEIILAHCNAASDEALYMIYNYNEFS